MSSGGGGIGHFDFDDGGIYRGGADNSNAAHGFGVCTGPGGQGEYSGAWQHGFESSGIYTWPNGNNYAGQWMQGKRHGLGVERRGHWLYRGEWTQGTMGRYGVRQSTTSSSKYEGTWTSGLQDGYGLETYVDGGTYQGQWMKGARHGYGVRKSALHSQSAPCRAPRTRTTSLTSIRSELENDPTPSVILPTTQLKPQEGRIGFFLKGKCEALGGVHPRPISISTAPSLRSSLPTLNDPRSTDDFGAATNADGSSRSSSPSTTPCSPVTPGPIAPHRDTLAVTENAIEIYNGEWKDDKRSGFGVSERSDGIKYEGEWANNCKNGYGATTYSDGTKEEGKYKNNILMAGGGKLHILLRASKLRDRTDSAVSSAQKAAQMAVKKSDIANSRMESARSKAELADQALEKGKGDNGIARKMAEQVGIAEQNRPQSVQRQNHQPRSSNSVREPDRTQNHLNQNHITSADSHQRYGQNLDPDNAHRPPEHQLKRRISDVVMQSWNQIGRKPSRRPSQMSFDDRSQEERYSSVRGSSTRRLPEDHEQGYDECPQEKREYSQTNSVGPSNRMYTSGPRRNPEDLRPEEHYDADRQRYSRGTQAGDPYQFRRRYSDARNYDLEDLPEYRDSREFDIAGDELFMNGSYDDFVDAIAAPDHTSTQVSKPLLSRPSLRIRRNVHCPELVVFNRKLDIGKKTTGNGILRRRLTLPSIVKYEHEVVGPVMVPPHILEAALEEEHPVVAVAQHPAKAIPEMHIIQDGVRKRLEQGEECLPLSTQEMSGTEDILDPPKVLPKRYKLETTKLDKRSNLGSLPDVSMFRQLEPRLIPRDQAVLLSQQKREEIETIRELELQLRQRAIVLKFGDLMAWFRNRQLAMFIVTVNIILAVMFYKLVFDIE